MAESSSLVHLEIADAVATVTLDSEHNRNALSRQLVTELSDHVATAEADDSVRAILIRSAGRVFCSGADLSEATSGSSPEDAPRAIVALQRQLATSAKPVVVQLQGPVRAGGLGIVGAADVVVAAESVTFALTEVRLGLAAATISLSLIARLDPRAASDTFLTARTFDATEAAAMGLVTRAVPDEELDSAVLDVIADLTQGSPQGLRESKALLNRDLVARIDELGDDVAEQSARLFASDEARAAMTAFLEKKGR